jgi:hypothetical protein
VTQNYLFSAFNIVDQTNPGEKCGERCESPIILALTDSKTIQFKQVFPKLERQFSSKADSNPCSYVERQTHVRHLFQRHQARGLCLHDTLGSVVNNQGNVVCALARSSDRFHRPPMVSSPSQLYEPSSTRDVSGSVPTYTSK